MIIKSSFCLKIFNLVFLDESCFLCLVPTRKRQSNKRCYKTTIKKEICKTVCLGNQIRIR
jgi:hypothetical protein